MAKYGGNCRGGAVPAPVMTKSWDFESSKESNPAEWPHPERIQCLRAFMECAHLNHPEHDMRGKEEEALRLAHEQKTAIGAFFVFEGTTRYAVVQRYHDFAQGWEYRRLLVNE